MNPFKSPSEAIAALEVDFNKSWLDFVKLHELETFMETDTENKHNVNVLASCKKTFRAGYMHGAEFISGVIISQMTSNPPKEPPK